MMRKPFALAALCAGLMFSSLSPAQDLPQRWVSAGGGLSEWIAALGGEARLVGVDTTSQHPPSLTALPSVGYQRQLSAEGILSLQPDVLVGTDEMGPPPVLAQIRQAGVRVELFSSEPTVAALDSTLERLGSLLGRGEQAQALATAYQQRLDTLQTAVSRAQTGQTAPGVLLLVGHAGGKPLIAGQGTAGDWLLQHAGARNLAQHSGYKPMSVEALAALDAQVLVVADRALSGDAAFDALVKENPGLATARAVREKRWVSLDPTLLVGGLGPRLPQALERLAQTFYPQAKIPATP